MKLSLLIILCGLFTVSIFGQQANSKLRFAFMTDIHLNYKNTGDCFQGLQKALQKIQDSNVEFVLFGGDGVDVDRLTANQNIADSLYQAFKVILDQTPLHIYAAIGNHDRFFDKNKDFVNGDELFKKYFKESYYSFDNKGVCFFVLNSVEKSKQEGYYVGNQQMEWLKNSLKNVSATTPIVVVTHVPIYSIYYPVVEGKYVFLDVVSNYKELLKAFEGYNLKLVLQGHQHLYEEIYSQNVQYITGGAVSAAWWNGPFHGTKEGFLVIDFDENNELKWNYIDYGWEAVRK